MTDNNNGLKTSDYQALAEFRYQIRRFLRFSEQTARQAGLEPQHHQLMLAVKGADDAGPRIAYLAERLQLQHHSAVELVDRLEQRGLIQKTRGDEDRREVHVKLTPRGERILKDLTLHHRKELQTAAPALVNALKKVTVAARGSRTVREGQRTGTALAEGRGSR